MKLSAQAEIDSALQQLRQEVPNIREAIASLAEIMVQKDTQALVSSSPLIQELGNLLARSSPAQYVAISKVLKSCAFVERIRTSLLKFKVFSILFAHLERHLLSTCHLAPLRQLLGQAKEIWEQVLSEHPNLPSILVSALKEAEFRMNRVEIAGMILILSPSNAKISVYEDIKSVLFPAAQDQALQSTALDCLMEASSLEAPRNMLLSMGVKDIIKPLSNSEDSAVAFTSCLVLALLAAGDENEKGGEPTPAAALSRVVEQVRTVALRPDPLFATIDGYQATSRILFISIRSMATNEGNLKALKESKLINNLKDMFEFRTGDVLLSDTSNLEEVFYLLSSPLLFPFPFPFFFYSGLLFL